MGVTVDFDQAEVSYAVNGEWGGMCDPEYAERPEFTAEASSQRKNQQ